MPTHVYALAYNDPVTGHWKPQSTIIQPPSDQQAPTAPTNVRLFGTPSQTSATITWDASTDDIGVTKYQVSKDGSSTWVDVINFSGRQYTDSAGVAGSVHTYRVRAGDASGKFSTPSTSFSVTFAASGGGGGGTLTRALMGMAATASTATWDTRSAQVEALGGHLEARRIFFASGLSDTGNRSVVSQSIADGMVPIISWKPSSTETWPSIAAGTQDSKMQAQAAWLATLNAVVYVCIWHEPFSSSHPPTVQGTGTRTDLVNAQIRAAGIFKAAGPKIRFCLIYNGWMWNSKAGNADCPRLPGETWAPSAPYGQTDAEIDTVAPNSLLSVIDVIACDTYQAETTTGSEVPAAECSAQKKANFTAWAKRKNAATPGIVKGLGIGEWSGWGQEGIDHPLQWMHDVNDPLWIWDLYFNSTGSLGDTVLTGDRLLSYQTSLRDWRKDGAIKPPQTQG